MTFNPFYFRFIVQKMATLSLVIVPAKVLKNGRHNVRIAVAHNGTTRYLLTGIFIDSSREFRNGAVVKRPDAAFLNSRLRHIIQEYQDKMDKISGLPGLSCPELVFLLKRSHDIEDHTLQSTFEEMIRSSTAKESTITANSYYWNSISKVIDTSCKLTHLTSQMINRAALKLRQSGLAPSSTGNYLMMIKQVIRFAEKNGYVRYEIDPFIMTKIPKPRVRESWISVEQVKAIRDADLKSEKTRVARDLFMLSYYLGGINMIDLLAINFKQCGRLKYERSKTSNREKINRFVEFDIPDEAKEIIKRYMSPDGFLRGKYINVKNKCCILFRYELKKIASMLNIDDLVYYSARKSFAQHALELGVATTVIDYILGHALNSGNMSNRSSLFHYVFVPPEMATNAIRKVLDNLK